ncbi:hypothetical protein DLM45_10815 [Hyphomicrobium methylovorum]|uniref:hypothetical protein n=1 Tax=Hyphomicrobium methylovorum TaxID=84 RepID=UPI0015E6C192|nr:hypothetical protein [Hyphomicrobium methylovorum]MBA2126703.1 hypothetical protein [Hyphomicrobium methylovorum]
MKAISDKEWDDLKASTAASFVKSTDEWLVSVREMDPQTALVALTMFVGHMLAGIAAEIGVADKIDAQGVGDAIAEIISEQLSVMRARNEPGSTLQ